MLVKPSQISTFLKPCAFFFKTQAMDQGVIRVLTAFSGTNVVRLHVKYIDAGENISNINVVEAMRILVKSQNAVSSNTLKNYFRKAGISQEAQIASIEHENDPFNELKSCGLIDENLVADDYVDIDFGVCMS